MNSYNIGKPKSNTTVIHMYKSYFMKTCLMYLYVPYIYINIIVHDVEAIFKCFPV